MSDLFQLEDVRADEFRRTRSQLGTRGLDHCVYALGRDDSLRACVAHVLKTSLPYVVSDVGSRRCVELRREAGADAVKRRRTSAHDDDRPRCGSEAARRLLPSHRWLAHNPQLCASLLRG